MVPSPQRDPALLALDAALPPSTTLEGRLVVLVGTSHGRLVQALAERYPELPAVLALEPDAPAARRVHELRAGDARLARLVLYGPDQLLPAHDFVAAYLTLCQFLMRAQRPSSALVAIVDPATRNSALGRSLALAASDLGRCFSREFLHAVASRPELAALLRGVGDFFAAQGEAYTALKFYSQVPAAQFGPQLVSAALSCLQQLGQAELCRHWLQAAPLDDATRERLRADCAHLTSREAERAERRERNLGLLERQFPDAAATLRASQPSPELFPLELSDGYPLLVRASGLQLSEENPRLDAAELDEALASCAQQGQDHVCFGRWVKYAGAAQRAIARPSLVRQHGWRRVTFLVEEDTSALSTLLGACELEPWFDAEQVRLFVGPGALERYVAALEANLHQPLPELSIAVPTAARDALLERRGAKLASTPERYRALDERYQRHPARLLDVLRHATRPLCIALMTSRYTTVLQYVTRDLAEAFEQLGHRCRIFKEARPGEELVSHEVARELLELEPDFLFVIDHIRPEYQGLLPLGLPVVTWILDELPPLKDQRLIAQLGSLDLSYGFNGAVAQGFRELGYPNVGRLPFAVNAARYFPEPPASNAQGIAFTTHIGQFASDPPGVAGLNARLLVSFDELPEIPLEMGKIRPLLRDCLQAMDVRVSPSEEQTLLYHALQVARQQDRQSVAEHVLDAGLPLSVFGLGWDALPRFAGCAHPSVAPGAELRQVYRQHQAVLHVNRGCNIHPRVLETLASGGLVIARWDPVDDEPGETRASFGDDLCLFRSRAELVELLSRALSDDAFRSDMITRGQARVLAQHTYVSRARQIVADLLPLVEAHVRESQGGPQPSREAQDQTCST